MLILVCSSCFSSRAVKVSFKVLMVSGTSSSLVGKAMVKSLKATTTSGATVKFLCLVDFFWCCLPFYLWYQQKLFLFLLMTTKSSGNSTFLMLLLIGKSTIGFGFLGWFDIRWVKVRQQSVDGIDFLGESWNGSFSQFLFSLFFLLCCFSSNNLCLYSSSRLFFLQLIVS